MAGNLALEYGKQGLCKCHSACRAKRKRKEKQKNPMNTFEALDLIDEIRRAGHVLTAKQAQGLAEVQNLLRTRLTAGRPRIHASDLDRWRQRNERRNQNSIGAESQEA